MVLSALLRRGAGLASAARVASASGAGSRVVRSPSIPMAAARRYMGGHARDIGLPGEHKPIEIAPEQELFALVAMVYMWLVMLGRAKEEGPHHLGMVGPLDFHGHGHDDDHQETEKYEPRFKFEHEWMQGLEEFVKLKPSPVVEGTIIDEEEDEE